MSGKLIITHGIPGSGKTTWAKAQVKNDPISGNSKRINRDDIRTLRFGEEYHKGKFPAKSEQEVSRIQNQLIKEGLNQGKTVYCDDTNLNPNIIINLSQIAKDSNSELKQEYFDVPVDECKRRNQIRAEQGGRKTPNFIIDNMAKKAYGKDGSIKEFRIGEKTVFAYDRSGSDGEKVVDDFNKAADRKYGELSGGTMNFDMDGTLADTRHISNKYMYGKKRNFDKFHKASEFCPPNEAVVELARQAHQNGVPITVTTARSDDYAHETINWLKNNGIPVRRLYMRPSGDFRSDFEVKREILAAAEKSGIFFAHCVDDNPQAVDAWKKSGIVVTEIPFHKPVDPNFVTESYAPIKFESIIESGRCIRCGSPLKNGIIGPKCAKK